MISSIIPSTFATRDVSQARTTASNIYVQRRLYSDHHARATFVCPGNLPIVVATFEIIQPYLKNLLVPLLSALAIFRSSLSLSQSTESFTETRDPSHPPSGGRPLLKARGLLPRASGSCVARPDSNSCSACRSIALVLRFRSFVFLLGKGSS